MVSYSQTFKVLQDIEAWTDRDKFAVLANIYKETLRELKNVFSGLYYIDGNNDRIKVHCVSGKQDRVTGKEGQENTIVLPLISISESGTQNSDSRRRTANVLVNETFWDPKEKRAKRVLSLAPRAVDLTYEVNIWTKYQSEMDQLRYAIFSMFNPSLDLRTKFNDLTKVFLENESDLGDYTAADTTDRLIQKVITLKVETYLPSPKFLYTNSGEIKLINTEYQLFDNSQDMETDTPISTEEIRQRI